jgi:hypothetical protein
LNIKLKIFSNKNWLPADSNYVIMLYPFWGDIPLTKNDPDYGRFDDYIENGKDIFEVTDRIDHCDYVLLPFDFSFDNEKMKITKTVALEAKNNKKKLIVFFNSDETRDILIDNIIVFRTSFFKSKQRPNEFAFPGWSVDFMRNFNSNHNILPKNVKAKISYCGYVDYLKQPQKSILSKIKSLLVRIKKENIEYGSTIRGKAIRTLLDSEFIDTDFIIRNGFWAQGIEDKLKVRNEYIINMFNSPYALVTRGAGNFSYRLYEVMSCGRIPVFINTDSVLPFENLINWKKHTIWIEEKDIKNIEQHIVNFHKFISDEDLKKMQIENRKIYEDYLSPQGYFKNLHTLL